MTSNDLSLNKLFQTNIRNDKDALSINCLYNEVSDKDLEMNINELERIKRKNKERLQNKYIEISNRCWKLMIEKAKNNKEELYYEVPIRVGHEKYYYWECIEFLIKVFKAKGIYCEQVYNTNFVYLNWENI
jgi:hypothetical protein